MKHVLIHLLALALIGAWGSTSRAETTSMEADRPRTVLFIVASAGDSAQPWTVAATEALTANAASLKSTAADAKAEAKRFEHAHSAEPSMARPEDIQAFKGMIKSAVSNLAEQNTHTALREFAVAFALYHASPDDYNRAIAIDVLDACLFHGRALSETGSTPQEVEKHLTKCRLMLPSDVEPRMMKHASMAAPWSRVLNKLRDARGAGVQIECSDGECLISVNGFPVGHADPVWVATLQSSEAEIRYSAECVKGQPGRIHKMTVKREKNQGRIQCAFESVLRSDPVLHLLYKDPKKLAQRAPKDASTIAHVLGVDSVVLVRPEPAGKGVVLALVDPKAARILAEKTLGEPAISETPWPRERVQQALKALLEDAESPSAEAETSESEPAAAHAISQPARNAVGARRAGAVLTSVGALGFATAVGLQVAGANRVSRIGPDETYLNTAAGRERMLAGSITGIGSMAFLAFGHFGLADYRDRNGMGYAPWTRIVLPLVFTGLTTAAVTEIFLAVRACDGDEPCAAQDIHQGRAILLGAAALSLFGPSLSALLRPQRSTGRSVNVGTSGNALYVRGRF